MPGSSISANKRASPSPSTTPRRLNLPSNAALATASTSPDPTHEQPTTTPTKTPTSSKIFSRHSRVKSLDALSTGHARDAMAGRIAPAPPSASSIDSPGARRAGSDITNEGSSGNTKARPVAKDAPAVAAAGDGRGAGGVVVAGESSPAGGAAPSQRQLNEYREKLARDLEHRELTNRGLYLGSDKARVSPIQEELVPLHLLGPGTTTTTTSTESGNTIRGGMTPATVANTPSYPFPRMASGAWAVSAQHRPFTSLSPTGAPLNAHTISFESQRGAHDKVLSGTSTPASNFTFQPSNMTPQIGALDFPNPNLYDLSLMLSSEPGLDAWWNTVVQIMKDVYQAERVTLAVPADTTDIENVPWGQKATYNGHQEDDLSLGYMAGGGSHVSNLRPSDVDSTDILFNRDDTLRAPTPQRPSITSRHSFTSYEDDKEKSQNTQSAGLKRPSRLARSKSYFPTGHPSRDLPGGDELNVTALHDHDMLEDQNIPSWEEPLIARQPSQGRVLPVLQALDYEADPLIDHSGVMRVLQRGKAVALTRTYPYLETNAPPEPASGAQKPVAKPGSAEQSKKPKKRSESIPKLTSMLTSRGSNRSKLSAGDKGKSINSRLEEAPPRPPTPKYEEYEQAPPSPWSQSPAPSPAVRPDPNDNPFFTDATVDEESFNPSAGPADYTGMRPPEAIGLDNSWTVLHIPLGHVLSKPSRTFKLSSAALDQRSQERSGQPGTKAQKSPDNPAPESPSEPSAPPLAILSILSPIIPYPSNLRHSLEHLAPHLATSFSLCRHYSHLETQLSGLRRRRPSTAGFGAVAPDGRPLVSAAYLAGAETGRQQSLAGSITSPSDYSGVSKSMTGSPLGTPGWDQGSLGYITDKRPAVSPAAIAQGGESYFSSKQRSAYVRHEALGSGSQSKSGSKESSPAEKRHSRLSTTQALHDVLAKEEQAEKAEKAAVYSDERASTSSKRSSLKEGRELSVGVPDEQSTSDAGEKQNDPSKHQEHGHTMLHSYGADFASTFQSLPPSSGLGSGLARPSLPSTMTSRAMSYNSAVVDMPPPSDKLKSLMLDSIPAHVFVALPVTGEVVWVNSRYLSYRGQTVTDLAEDPWSSIHPDDCDEYLKEWGHCLRTGDQFSRTVRIKRFDGAYRWFHAKAVASKDKRGVIMQFLGSYMDIHEQHIAELKSARQEEIEASEAKHRLLANLIPQIIFTATEEDGITFANEQWLSYTGQSFGDSLGLGFMDFVHPEDLARCRIPVSQPPTPMASRRPPEKKMSESNLRGVHKALSRSNSSDNGSLYELPTADLTELAKKGIIKVTTDSNGRVSYTTEVRLRSKKGEYRWHLIRCVQIDTIDFGSGASSYFGSATDINDHKLLETKLKEAMEAKGRFLSNMSHEIRTPLIGISGMVSFLQDTTLNEEQRDYTNTIQTSANSLIMIINDILDLSKVDAGMMKLKFEWFHTRSLIEDVNELVSTMAIAKGLELNYLVEADVPAWVKGDKVRIRQVLLNVIGNAIKFTSAGEVFSRCKVLVEEGSDDEDNEIMLEYAITDTGQGFTKEEAELIFKPFSQIDGSSTRQHGGSGLGLVISKQLVELHGGTMGGTAVPGKGSTFVFSARFALPTPEDHPKLPGSPVSTLYSVDSQHQSTESVPENIKQLPPPKHLRQIEETASAGGNEQEFASPGVTSNGSSNQSGQSIRTQITDRSSATSVNTGLARFSEAAKASGQDLSQMKLEMPSGRSSPGRTATPGNPGQPSPDDFRPPMYSILIICPQTHSREATTQHIEMTLPKDVPHQITALSSAAEANELIGGADPIKFTHIVINLGSAEAVIDLLDKVVRTQKIEKTTILILSDSVQRQAVLRLATNTTYEQLFHNNQVTFIYKPVKPSRFAVIFDPEKRRDLSTDHNRSSAQQMVENQKASYQEIEKRMGNKGYKVLLVEDNPVNQKVLMKYLNKIGVAVEVAVDGAECTDMVISRPHNYYSLILCDLHMPRKDGYQACREIRHWEKSAKFPSLPIIALSANVMSDVQDKCVAAGFSDYVTKPVDFIDLSRAMSNFF